MGFDFVNGVAPIALNAVSASYEINYETSSSYAENATSASFADYALIATNAAYSDNARQVLINSTLDSVMINSGSLQFNAASVKVDGVWAITYTTLQLVTSGSGGQATGSILTFRNGLLLSSSLVYR